MPLPAIPQPAISRICYRVFMARSTDHRAGILEAAAVLLSEGGVEAVTTRSVSAAAGVQPPTLYRLFGDMRGLLDAVVADGFDRYLAEKARVGRSGDARADLERGWELHVGFGVAHPAHYRLMYALGAAHGLAGVRAQADARLRALVDAVAAEGRLLIDPDAASRMIHAAGMGVTLQLIDDGATDPLAPLSVATRDAVLARVVSSRAPVEGGRGPLAIALRADLASGRHGLTPGEALLLDEMLARIGRG
jgi:AcrR family transcriptional regulator